MNKIDVLVYRMCYVLGWCDQSEWEYAVCYKSINNILSVKHVKTCVTPHEQTKYWRDCMPPHWLCSTVIFENKKGNGII